MAFSLLAAWYPVLPASGQVNVTEHHNHDSRDGLYIDASFTAANAAALARDTNFNGTIAGNVYAQPLYIEGGPGSRAMIIAVTESNKVYALDATNGSVIWQRNVGAPVPLSKFDCGNIDPLGITGTPIVDLPSRTLFFDAMTTPDGGTTKKHLIYALNVDTGTTNSGWPVDVNATATSGSTVFTSVTQNERGALGIVSNIVYVPYGGHYGDCDVYHGWLVGVPLNNPASVMAWATTTNSGGSWAVSGVASDGANPYIGTGNTEGATTWSGGEAVIRFQTGPVFSGLTNDYWAATNWQTLDNNDTDIGSSGAMLVDVPGATPSKLVVALGKDGNAYLLNRTNLGGIHVPLAQAHVSSNVIIQASATYRTTQGTYVAFRVYGYPSSSTTPVSAFRITATSPPTITSIWSVSQSGMGSPFVTSTDGTNNVVVWVIGSEGDQRLHGYDGDTGNVVYSGGGANELMTGTRRFNTGIAARGRIYVANDNQVYAFTVPVPPPRANFFASPTNGFAPLTVTFTNLSSGATNYSWAFGDGNVSTNTSPANTYANSGVYSVTLAVIGPGGADALTGTNYIVVAASVAANFTGSPSYGVAPLLVTFTNLSTGATNYSWAFGDGNLSTNTNPANTYTNPGVYSVTLTAVGPGGTNALTRANYIGVVAPVVPNFTGSPTYGAAPLLVTFTNLSTGATNYSWAFGDGNLSSDANPANTYTNPGVYSVTLTAIGPGGADALTLTNYIAATAPPPLGLGQLFYSSETGFQFIVSNADGTPISQGEQVRIGIYAADDLALAFTNWSKLTNTALLTNGLLQITDPDALLFMQRFYRSLEAP